MDVVRSNVRLLNGRIDISSQIGKGTQITIHLPTSLMVSKGILFRAGGEDYIVPMDSLVDMTKLPRSAIRDCQGQRMAHIRGQVYQLISMVDLLGDQRRGDRATPGKDAEQPEEVPVAIVQHGELRYGIIVDRFIDEVEVIIKPLIGGLADLSLFSGATIMGDGQIVLVINPMELPRHQQAHGNGSPESRLASPMRQAA
jgi:two-component system chemotaxis sensor kinase CheA